MSYQLVLREPVGEKSKDIGENIFVDDLLDDYKVYLFYYPGAMPNYELENTLRNFGNITGKNLFVNIGRLNDPKYLKMRNTFSITNLPALIVTGVDGLAALKYENYYSTAYVRLDNQRLQSIDLTIKSVERLFDLFIGGEISNALKEVEHEKRDMIVSHVKARVINALRQFAEYLSDKDISVSVFEGKLELKKSKAS
jgi:hypothetical protein